VYIALAWDPATTDLTGTESSTDTSVANANRRFDIKGLTGTSGMQKGEDTDSIALLMKMIEKSGPNGFSATGMTLDDQYEIQFTIGGSDFSMLFRATGAAAGTMSLFYKPTGSGTWYSGETFSQSGIGSGTTYTSVSGNLGFNLKSMTPTTTGHVRLIVKKSYLVSLGATGSSVTYIFSATFANGNGSPGSGGTTPNDRCPSTGTASWTLSGDIPEFPLSPLVSGITTVAIYLYLRRHENPRPSKGKKPVAQHTA